MNTIEVRRPNHDELTKVQHLRHAVLDPARPIKTDQQLGPADYAEENIHMAAFSDGEVVGTVRLDMTEANPPAYEVRKVAVDPAFVKRGIGKSVLEAALLEAQSNGCELVTLDARQEAIPFFEKLGFRQLGNCVIQADGMQNYRMSRNLH